MGRFNQNCNSLAHTVEVNTLNEKLIRKFKNIKKSKSLGYSIMQRVVETNNTAVFAFKTGSWFVQIIKNVFDQ